MHWRAEGAAAAGSAWADRKCYLPPSPTQRCRHKKQTPKYMHVHWKGPCPVPTSRFVYIIHLGCVKPLCIASFVFVNCLVCILKHDRTADLYELLSWIWDRKLKMNDCPAYLIYFTNSRKWKQFDKHKIFKSSVCFYNKILHWKYLIDIYIYLRRHHLGLMMNWWWFKVWYRQSLVGSG